MITKQLPSAKMEICGFFKLEAVDEVTGKRRVLADWFQNLILNQGLNRLGIDGQQSRVFDFVHVGSGSTAPAVTDTQLQTFVAATNTVQGSSSAYVAGPPAYTRSLITRRFAAGTATGNLSEVGIGWSATPSHLFSRALIKDSGGTPTTITVLASEALDVTYEFRIYPPADVSSSITISGTSYNYTIRPQQISSTTDWGAGTVSFYNMQAGTAAASHVYAYDGPIGAATSSPSGTQFGSSSSLVSNSAYSNNSYQRNVTMTFGLNDANLASGIKSISLPMYGVSTWQIEFTPVLAKTATKVLTLNFTLSWARRP